MMLPSIAPALLLSLAVSSAAASRFLPHPLTRDGRWTRNRATTIPATTITTQKYSVDAELTWGPCPDRFPTAPNVECANYTVPLDWDHPDGDGDGNGTETVTLGILRVAATGDPSRRIGNLFINPGGPGGQATAAAVRIAAVAAPEILERFDIIAVDPRGVGLSTPVLCDVATFNRRVSFFPRTEAEYEDLVAYNAAVGASCRARSGRLLDFVDTISAARDHEAVRLALGGDEKASFIGLSYGTQLFSQYAELFPDGIRAMVLDGILQHSQAESSNLLIESATYEATLRQFFAWCAGADECALRGGDAQQAFLDVLARAAADGAIPAPECDDGPATGCRSSVTEEDVRFNVQGFLISPSNWPALGQALADARDDANATLISQAQPIAVGDAYEDSYLFGGAAVQCQDWSHGGARGASLAWVREKETLGAALSPLTRGACQSYRIQTSCIGWPAPLRNPERPVRYAGDATILMVNSVYDPSTGYAWALGLHAELGPDSAVLLTRNGSGHTSWTRGGETAAAEDAYLLNLTLPDAGTVLDS